MSETIDTLLKEDRIYTASDEFKAQANLNDSSVYDSAEEDWQGWWTGWAEKLHWFKKWDTVLEWNRPYAKWFLGGKINACYNCVDRHVLNGLGEKVAWIAEGEPGDIRRFTYSQVLQEVQKLANALKSLGVSKGDRVCIYMGQGPELTLSMLACARIGAAHSVVFGGFSAQSLYERINDASAKLVITADGAWRRGGIVPLKSIVDAAIEMGCPSLTKVLVYERVGNPGSATEGVQVPDYDQGNWNPDRDVWWHDIVPNQSPDCPCEEMDSEDLLYILYTSGSTGKPKGIMHTTGGYLTGTYATSHCVFDMKDSDVYWCTADCGWVTGHSYVVYGPMANGVTQVLYEGAPDTPEKDRFWRIIERHKVTILYTAPTAIRTFMKWGEEYPAGCDLTSLRLLGTVGEPINPEAWVWYHRVIGGGNCPIVDTWWQTETGAIMITPLPGITETRPGSATRPFPGVYATIFNEEGEDLLKSHGAPVGGFLVLNRPWPSMLRGIWGDPERFVQTYWSKFSDAYFAGDGAKVDDQGFFWLLGRVDDILLVSGHNISTMEVESALVDHPSVAEAAVIGKTHEIKGQAVAAFVILRGGHEPSEELKKEIRDHVGQKIGPIAKPDDLFFTAELPKTRSGKIMRRLLRDVAEGRALGDVTTLSDPAVVAALKGQYEEKEG
ncbi:acetate--CoA ligase [Kamptonema cortianum]|nr:acetate--CoA ligase [Geitlerinema splendidum]MDK3162190.1 acetate--CoA ligase [Kamptonema cortianum]